MEKVVKDVDSIDELIRKFDAGDFATGTTVALVHKLNKTNCEATRLVSTNNLLSNNFIINF